MLNISTFAKMDLSSGFAAKRNLDFDSTVQSTSKLMDTIPKPTVRSLVDGSVDFSRAIVPSNSSKKHVAKESMSTKTPSKIDHRQRDYKMPGKQDFLSGQSTGSARQEAPIKKPTAPYISDKNQNAHSSR